MSERAPSGADVVLLGYFPKRLVPPPAWMRELGIEEIGSVSRCIAGGPDGWLDAWRHNEWGLFGGPGSAWSVVPGDRRTEFRLHAYALHPFEFVDGEERPMELAEPDVTPLGPDDRRMGWDVVSRSTGSFYECSPLSCNLLAKELRVNRYCLFDDLASARELARTAERRRVEPGPYHVIEVWRREGVPGEGAS